MRITKSLIDKMTYEDVGDSSAGIVWDDTMPGFGVRFLKTGRKSFILRYKIGNRKRYLTLGSCSVMTVAQARDVARDRLHEVRQGRDPAEEKRKKASIKTVSQMIDIYLERHAKPLKRSWRHDEQRLNRYVRPVLGRMKLGDVRKADIAKLHHEIGTNQGKPGAANHVVRCLSKMFACAQDWGFCDQKERNPAKGIKQYTQLSRERFVTHEEMPALAESINAEPNIYVRSLIWMYLFTGCRKSELRSIKWEDVNLKTRELKIGITKNGKPHYLPLNDSALGLLNELPRQLDNPYVFCGKLQGRPLVNIDGAWRRIRQRADLEDVCIHDLRRTVGSWLVQKGASLALIGKILNHKHLSTTAIYSRFSQKPIRDALDGHASDIAIYSQALPSIDTRDDLTIH